VHEIFTYLRIDAGRHGRAEDQVADAFGAAGLSGKETAVIYEQSMNSGFGQSCRGYYLLTMLGYPKIKVLTAVTTPGRWRASRRRRTFRARQKPRSPSVRRPATS